MRVYEAIDFDRIESLYSADFYRREFRSPAPAPASDRSSCDLQLRGDLLIGPKFVDSLGQSNMSSRGFSWRLPAHGHY